MENARADLHLHTTASDGRLAPAQVVEGAARAGLAAIAISDHDTVDGIEEAVSAGNRLGIEVVPAVEINTDIGAVEAHILGYFIDWKSEKFEKELQKLRNGRFERGKKIVEKLRALGISITLEQVLAIAGPGPICRPHVARALYEAGVVESPSGAFSQFLVRGAPAYVERIKMSPYDAVSVIVDAGGVAGFAHPAHTGHDELIPLLMKSGLGALEVFYPNQPPETTLRYQALARKFGLIATGGSDAHGTDAEGGTSIGAVTVDARAVEQLRKAAYPRRSR
ncbi:MAG: PHP domain-containing protein [Armatimonadota bacterium]